MSQVNLGNDPHLARYWAYDYIAEVEGREPHRKAMSIWREHCERPAERRWYDTHLAKWVPLYQA
jgi:hypothetical protein